MTKKLNVDDKGFTCPCGKRHDFNGYVYAHWQIELVLHCDCKRKFSIIEGTAEEVMP